MTFLHALWHYPFLQIVMLAGLASAVASGVVGPLVVSRRIAFMAGGIAHSVLGGLGIAHWLGAPPLLGALLAAVVSALLIAFASLRARENEDMLIGALWAVGMAIGIIALAQAPGYSVNLMSYLLGSLMMATRDQVVLMLGLNALMLGLLWLSYRPLMATLFDPEFAALRGVPTGLLYSGFLVVVALAVVVLVYTVGLVMVMALVTLPAATARLGTARLPAMMLAASGAAMLAVVLGLAVAYAGDTPAGATIVLCAALLYLAGLLIRHLAQRQRRHTQPKGP
ncbi:MAG: metal ABC transporter permease [Halomonas sp.]|uniref:metal ABC transporter permease n=1 Tax=Halomonas sp. TaxID=1486246 RepID=UPI00286FD3C7|nr:metal ABC transporter permease [Halomonas sp.]MDR9438569.1 metal ABC transporter permease [Halomonas sp.]